MALERKEWKLATLTLVSRLSQSVKCKPQGRKFSLYNMKGGTSDMRDPCVFMAASTFSKLGIFGAQHVVLHSKIG